jgi:hypothetical protein
MVLDVIKLYKEPILQNDCEQCMISPGLELMIVNRTGSVLIWHYGLYLEVIRIDSELSKVIRSDQFELATVIE